MLLFKVFLYFILNTFMIKNANISDITGMKKTINRNHKHIFASLLKTNLLIIPLPLQSTYLKNAMAI